MTVYNVSVFNHFLKMLCLNVTSLLRLLIGSAFAYNRKVHKYGNSTTGESWDIVVDEDTYYE